jgi:hypothetical protein
MSRRCKPGIRARIIRSSNAGKIVVVVRRYFGESVNDARWPRALILWVVTSLGSPLRSVYIATGKEAPPSMTIVVDDCDLEPLSDDDEFDSETTGEYLMHNAQAVPRPTNGREPKRVAIWPSEPACC